MALPESLNPDASPESGTGFGGMDVRPVFLFGSVIIAVFFVGFGALSATLPLESAAIAPGIVTSENQSKTIQHLEGGILREILVREGEPVIAGQILVKFDRVNAEARLSQLKSAYLSLAGRATRLATERDGTDQVSFSGPLFRDGGGDDVKAIITGQRNVFEAKKKLMADQVAILQQRISQAEAEILGLRRLLSAERRQLDLVREELEAIRVLHEKGLVESSRLSALQAREAEVEGSMGQNEAEIARVEQGIGETRIRITELTTSRISDAADDLQAVEAKMLELQEEIRAAEDILARTDVFSPIDGTIVGLRVHSPGGVVGPGEAMMHIVPRDERLLIDARVDPDDIEVMTEGMEADVRLTAFSQRHVTPLHGRLISLSADRLVDEATAEPYYLARVEVLDDAATVLEGAELQPGMQANVYFQTGETTLFEYLVQPIRQSFHDALREK